MVAKARDQKNLVMFVKEKGGLKERKILRFLFQLELIQIKR